MTSVSYIVIEIMGEGRTDIGLEYEKHVEPILGVIPVLLHKICDSRPEMRVINRRFGALQKKVTIKRKFEMFRRQAKINGSHGCAVVVDADNNPNRIAEVREGLSISHNNFPTAIGVARPCIESWLLADASALRRGLGLIQKPVIPNSPDEIGADSKLPQQIAKDIFHNVRDGGKVPNLIEKTAIAKHSDLLVLESISPSFTAFANEVRVNLLPLFPAVKSDPMQHTTESGVTDVQ